MMTFFRNHAALLKDRRGAQREQTAGQLRPAERPARET